MLEFRVLTHFLHTLLLLVLLTFTCGSNIAYLLVPQRNCKHDMYNKTFMASKVWVASRHDRWLVLYMHNHNFAEYY